MPNEALDWVGQAYQGQIPDEVLERSRQRAERWTVDEANLSDQIMNHAAIIGFLGAALANATSQELIAKHFLKQTEAKVLLNIRGASATKRTVPEVEALVDCNNEVIKARKQFQEASYLKDRVSADLSAAQEKSFLLRIVAKQKEREMQI
jgi:hypothetical protein